MCHIMPKNKKYSLNVNLRKDALALDPAGALSDYNAPQAAVKCEGWESAGKRDFHSGLGNLLVFQTGDAFFD